jgi:hypothetical protein
MNKTLQLPNYSNEIGRAPQASILSPILFQCRYTVGSGNYNTVIEKKIELGDQEFQLAIH